MNDFSQTDPIWRRKPFDHQVEIARFHHGSAHTIDASDVGVGKTLPMIAAMQTRFDDGVVKSALVIAPNSILDNWQNELRNNSDLTVTMLRGTRDKRIKLIHAEPQTQVYVINYEAVRTVIDDLLWLDADLIICDEIHHIKSYRSQQTKQILKLGKQARARKGMTGTLLTNDLTDLWSVAQFISPKIFGTNFWGFRQKFMYNANANKSWAKWPDWRPKDGAVEEVQKILEPCCIRFEKRQVLKFLPPVLFERRQVEMQGEQRRVYNDLKRHFIAELKDGEPLVASEILARVIKLLEITSGFAYRDGKPYRFDQNAKLNELMGVLSDLGNKQAIIWCAFQEDARLLRDQFSLDDPIGVLTGTTPAPKRQELVDGFNKGDYRYLICNPACAGEGLTILAPYAVYYSRNYKLGERLQSLGRNDRPGAEKYDNLTVIDLVVENSIDQEVLATLEGKEDLLRAINPKRWEAMLK